MFNVCLSCKSVFGKGLLLIEIKVHKNSMTLLKSRVFFNIFYESFRSQNMCINITGCSFVLTIRFDDKILKKTALFLD